MKNLFIILSVLLSVTAVHSEVRLNGAAAEKTFNSLENQFEYKSGASVSGLKIETIVRHDNSVSCSKESVQYDEEEASVTFECIVK